LAIRGRTRPDDFDERTPGEHAERKATGQEGKLAGTHRTFLGLIQEVGVATDSVAAAGRA
jgi:hypothetical protein